MMLGAGSMPLRARVPAAQAVGAALVARRFLALTPDSYKTFQFREVSEDDGKPRDITLSYRPYDVQGSGKSCELRKKGMIPGVLYGHIKRKGVLKAPFMVPKRVLLDELKWRGRSFENTLYNVTVQSDGIMPEIKFLAIPTQTQFCSVTQEVLSFNFLIYQPKRVVKIPIAIKGEELNAEISRKEAFYFPVQRYVNCMSLDGQIPKEVELNVGKMKSRTVVHFKDLQIPENLHPMRRTQKPDLVMGVFRKAG